MTKDVAQLLRQALEAVQEAEIPEALQEAAFKEAIALLRADEGPAVAPPPDNEAESRPDQMPSEHTTGGSFFSKLAEASGVREEDLRQVVSWDEEKGRIKVVRPPRELGDTAAQRAQRVISLVAGARYGALGEDPVNVVNVREECDRLKCYQSGNFNKHVRALQGFNMHGKGSKACLQGNVKWEKEFEEAVASVLGNAGR